MRRVVASRGLGLLAAISALLGGVAATAPVAVAAPAAASTSAAVPAVEPRQFTLDTETVVSGLRGVVGLASPRDGTNRLFLLERDGRIRVVNTATKTVQPEPYLDISSLVGTYEPYNGRTGLIDVAFNPAWNTSPFVYLTYRDRSNYLQVVRYRPTGGDPNARTLDLASATTVLVAGRTPAPYNLFTGGGQLEFGSDGLLYLAIGGRESGAPQNLSTLKGKVLRINVGCGTAVYCIPANNPFARDTTGKRKEIWAWGVHAPYGLSIDAATGTAWIADRGGDQFEVTARPQAGLGGNLGYPCYDGRARTGTGCVAGTAYILPNFDMSASAGGAGVGMTSGLVYRGPQAAARGFYVFGKSEWYFRVQKSFLLTHNPGGSGAKYYTRGEIPPRPPCCDDKNTYAPPIAGFGEGDGRELYAALDDGTLRRIVVR